MFNFLSPGYLYGCALIAALTSGLSVEAKLTLIGIRQERALQSEMHIQSAFRLNDTSIQLKLVNGQLITLDFYGNQIFRLFQDNSGGILRTPEAKPVAEILVGQPRREVTGLTCITTEHEITIRTAAIAVQFDRRSGGMLITDLRNQKLILEMPSNPYFEEGRYTLSFKNHPDEYYYGGGVQNGRFSHRGKIIKIVNENSWTDGGVASPAPFYWSTRGYAFLGYTFAPGEYDFGASHPDAVSVTHQSPYMDVFIMVDETPVALLNDYYQLTGHPVLLPKFGFYEGHLNAYNRDFWKEDANGILFEDGKRYKESQKDNGGTRETLNGEEESMQFSARAVIDRYQQNDMPLGWILPNDGYGAGYGQTETLDGNIANLKAFGDYARSKGVEIGLWTQSDLHPKAGISALLQRDIVKEVRDAGVRVLKTDVAWVGDGYSFGLNGVADVAGIMPYYGNQARPFIITLDGWAGTQRYASVWTGDQTGGEWEYIRFHIPTYLGAGLSGMSNITSDMDGIFGGKNPVINARDFQWKAFTPMQLNMDGWGANPKYPQALGEPTTSINRFYLKLKSMFIPYTYTIAHEAITGKPMMRAMMLDEVNSYTLGNETRYQFLYGPSILVAPVYRNTCMDREGHDVRNRIYLPEGEWIDYFTGEVYKGGCILNEFKAPIWKLPLFIKAGAIIPMTYPNNNVGEIDKHVRIFEIYPSATTSFTLYDDDGVTNHYLKGAYATTRIEQQTEGNKVKIRVHQTKGNFDGFEKLKKTIFRINVTAEPDKVIAYVGKRKVKLTRAKSEEAFEQGHNVIYYNEAPELNRFSTPGSPFASQSIRKNPQLWIKIAEADVTLSDIDLRISGFVYDKSGTLLHAVGALTLPEAQIAVSDCEPYALTPSWKAQPQADYYEIKFENQIYTTIRGTRFRFEDLKPETDYVFQLRAVNRTGKSDWATINGRTLDNPLQYAIRGIKAESSAVPQEGFEPGRLVDFAEAGDIWHTQYRVKAVPFTLTLDLGRVYTVSHFDYLPRLDAGNGTLLKGAVEISMDKLHWTKVGDFVWSRNGDVKPFTFETHPEARYIRLNVTEAVGNYGSGRELYVYEQPGSTSYLQGDINADQKVDANDLTSYLNYTGLRKGDKDFEGYISKGDLNRNGRIDAYDISVVATQLEGGVICTPADSMVRGTLQLVPDKRVVKSGEMVDILVRGKQMYGVNALGFALPYDAKALHFEKVIPLQTKYFENMTYNRLHSNGEQILYPTFVAVGNQSALQGNADLFILRFKVTKNMNLSSLKAEDLIWVSKNLQVFP